MDSCLIRLRGLSRKDSPIPKNLDRLLVTSEEVMLLDGYEYHRNVNFGNGGVGCRQLRAAFWVVLESRGKKVEEGM